MKSRVLKALEIGYLDEVRVRRGGGWIRGRYGERKKKKRVAGGFLFDIQIFVIYTNKGRGSV